jgi:hypothetical protein
MINVKVFDITQSRQLMMSVESSYTKAVTELIVESISDIPAEGTKISFSDNVIYKVVSVMVKYDDNKIFEVIVDIVKTRR